MSESQSRYGIIEEMKNRKIKEREKLANIEKELDENTFKEEQHIAKIEQEIKNADATYEFNHKSNLREMQTTLKLFKSDCERRIREYEREIDDEENTYVLRHKKFVNDKKAEIKRIKENLDRYTDIYTNKIKVKKEIIEEIEEGINDLKEISKEQKE